MRGLTENFFRNYGDFQVGAEGHSLPLNVICMSEPTVTSYENYILKFVQPMEIEAQTAILYVLPMVLRINLRIIMLHNEMVCRSIHILYRKEHFLRLYTLLSLMEIISIINLQIMKKYSYFIVLAIMTLCTIIRIVSMVPLTPPLNKLSPSYIYTYIYIYIYIDREKERASRKD